MVVTSKYVRYAVVFGDALMLVQDNITWTKSWKFFLGHVTSISHKSSHVNILDEKEGQIQWLLFKDKFNLKIYICKLLIRVFSS